MLIVYHPYGCHLSGRAIMQQAACLNLGNREPERYVTEFQLLAFSSEPCKTLFINTLLIWKMCKGSWLFGFLEGLIYFLPIQQTMLITILNNISHVNQSAGLSNFENHE
jgi:hypothetical protein